MIFGFAAGYLVVLALAYVSFKHLTAGPPLSKIRGPKSSSFILGNLLELYQRPVGQVDFEWQHLYGDIVRLKTVFGADQLLVTDPKALQWILHKSAYQYPKPPMLRVMIRLISGKGIAWAAGKDHQRQRNVVLPGFGGPECKTFLNVFQGCAESMSNKWMEIIGSSSGQKAVLNIQVWFSRATLDAIAAFDVPFGAIDSDSHPLATMYNNMISVLSCQNDVLGRPSAQQIFVQAASNHVPLWILEWLSDHAPTSNPRLKRAREVKRTATKVARDMVRERFQSLLAGKGSRDIFSLLVKANMDAGAKNKLTEEGLLSQMCSILLAGHETTSNSLGWILFEISLHPEIQCRLRSEIREVEAAVRARGDTQFTMDSDDFDAMPYTTAVIKEGLRYHPVVPYVQRVAARDDILPLSRPVTTNTGDMINEVVVPKGTQMVVSIAAYNQLWGEDAHKFNPDRWLDGVASGQKAISVWIYSNLMTFLGGVRGCLGWRFAVLEIQAFLIEIIGKFEFAMTDKAARITGHLSGQMVPMVDGELERGSQLLLAVSAAAREDHV